MTDDDLEKSNLQGHLLLCIVSCALIQGKDSCLYTAQTHPAPFFHLNTSTKDGFILLKQHLGILLHINFCVQHTQTTTNVAQEFSVT